jgi:hypothetical protein
VLEAYELGSEAPDDRPVLLEVVRHDPARLP